MQNGGFPKLGAVADGGVWMVLDDGGDVVVVGEEEHDVVLCGCFGYVEDERWRVGGGCVAAGDRDDQGQEVGVVVATGVANAEWWRKEVVDVVG